MARLFLSHASADKPQVRQIAEDLCTAGHQVWLDELEIHVGHSIASRIQQGLHQADFVIVVLSKHSVQSGWVEKEWQSRIGREAQRRSIEILPVLIDECAIPGLLADKNYADLRNYSEGMRRLLASIEHHQAAPAASVPPAPSGSKTRSRPMLIGAGIFFAGVLAFTLWRASGERPGQEQVKDDDVARELLKRAIAESSRKSGRAPERPLATITEDDIGVDVSARAWNNGVQVQVRLSGVPRSTDVFLSTDGASYEKKSPSATLNLSGVGADTLYIKLESRTDASKAGPFVKRGLFTDALRSAFEAMAGGDPDSLVKCSPSGCEIERQVLCASGAKLLKLSRKPGGDEFNYDLRKCSGPDLPYIPACASSPNQIFPLRPGATIYAHMEYEGGARIPFQFTVARSAGEYDANSGKWVELEPLGTEQPFAAATLGNTWGPFEIFLGAGGCPPSLTQEVTAILYDLDGRGLVEATDPGRVQVGFAIPHTPSSGKIAIAFDHISGERVGPFTYRFDVDKIVRASAKFAEQPRLDCTSVIQSGGTKRWTCLAPGRTQVLSWVDVHAIRYGSSAAALTRTASISVTAQDVVNVTGLTGTAPPNDSVARFDVPSGWTDLYYQLVLVGKGPTPPIRIPLQ